MGNKCCSKRPEPHIGSKKNDKFNSNLLGGKNDSLDSRYTPDPNRGKHLTGGGVDIIRPRNSKYIKGFSSQFDQFSSLFLLKKDRKTSEKQTKP